MSTENAIIPLCGKLHGGGFLEALLTFFQHLVSHSGVPVATSRHLLRYVAPLRGFRGIDMGGMTPVEALFNKTQTLASSHERK